MNIHVFNSGRFYGPALQPIAWTVVEQYWDGDLVSFADAGRGIDGIVKVRCTSDADVLRAYDEGDYVYDENRERVRALYDAANATIAPEHREW